MKKSARGFQITVFKKGSGILSKRITLKKDGTIDSDGSACRMAHGFATRTDIADVHALAKVIDGLKSFEALALGTPRLGLEDKVKIVTKEELEKRLNGVVSNLLAARSEDDIIYDKGRPAFALIDFDSKGMTKEVAKKIAALGGPWAALLTILPALSTAARVSRRSTSTGLYHGKSGKKFKGSGGTHDYLAISNGRDSERFLKTLHDRCWLHGLGWIWIDRAGRMHDRSIIDKNVYGSERLVFEGAPQVVPPLKQDTNLRRPIATDGEILNTRSACPSLTDEQRERVEALKAEAKKPLEPEAEKARKAYVKEHAPAMAKRTGKTVEECERIPEQAAQGELAPETKLIFVKKEFKGATVADVLRDPKRFEKAVLADPVEGVADGPTTAMVLLGYRDGRPFIKSHSHGGIYYRLLSASRPAGVTVPMWRDFTKEGDPKPSMYNARLAITALGIVCSFDTFHTRMLVGFRDDTVRHALELVLGDVSDNTIIRLRQMISEQYGVDMLDGPTRDAVISLALEHCFDPVRDMLDRAEGAWDGVERLDRMAVTHFNCADAPLNHAIVRKMMIAAVRRVRQPGCKFDNIVVLELPEGWEKSTAFRVLAGDENFSDASILGHTGAREVQEQLAGVWIHENAELAGMKKAEVEQVKAYASRQEDSARPAYGRLVKKQARHSIDVATTNSHEYLQAQSNRRFWPLELLRPLDIALFKRDRLLLWGEAAAYESAGESIVLDRELWPVVGKEQEKHRVRDPWEEILDNMPTHVVLDMHGRPELLYLTEKDKASTHHIPIRHFENDGAGVWRELVVYTDLLRYVLGIPIHQQNKSHGMRLAEIMQKLGWKKDRFIINAVQVRGYMRKIDDATRQKFNWQVGEPVALQLEPAPAEAPKQEPKQEPAPEQKCEVPNKTKGKGRPPSFKSLFDQDVEGK